MSEENNFASFVLSPLDRDESIKLICLDHQEIEDEEGTKLLATRNYYFYQPFDGKSLLKGDVLTDTNGKTYLVDEDIPVSCYSICGYKSNGEFVYFLEDNHTEDLFFTVL